MKQPKNEMNMVDDRDGEHNECSITVEEIEHGGFAWIASGRTPLIAHRAAVRRLKRLLREEERTVAKLEKGAAK